MTYTNGLLDQNFILILIKNYFWVCRRYEPIDPGEYDCAVSRMKHHVPA